MTRAKEFPSLKYKGSWSSAERFFFSSPYICQQNNNCYSFYLLLYIFVSIKRAKNFHNYISNYDTPEIFHMIVSK